MDTRHFECNESVDVGLCFFFFQHPDKNVTLILSGDFNSSPADGIYKLMTTKCVPEDHINWKSSKNYNYFYNYFSLQRILFTNSINNF